MPTQPPSTPINELSALCAILENEGGIPRPSGGWCHRRVAELLGVPAAMLCASVRNASGIAADTSATNRIDRVLGAISAHHAIPPGGWSSASLAAFAGVHEETIRLRLNEAMNRLRRAAAKL